MTKLSIMLFIFISPTIAGALVIGVLVADMALSNAMPIVIAAAIGVVAAVPASYLIARAILNEPRRPTASQSAAE